ncbi:MAG TPA: O-antigen ligase family protein [Vicinamibacterales bacterium]|jgi:O-antigen ligase|nr:O-antigen ligase family protein [Vicinamibacterales bacterium]
MPDTVAAAAPPDRLEQAGLLTLFGVAAALQFSIAAAEALLAVSIICWLTLLATGRTRVAAPRFFLVLLAYAAITLVSTTLSPDPRASLFVCKQMVLFLLVPLTCTFMNERRAPVMVTVIVTFAAISAALGIFEYGILHFDNLHRRIQGTLGHYMTYSGLLMLVVGLALARVLFGREERLWSALVIPALAVAIALSFTRTAAVGACAGAALLFALKDFRLVAIVPVAAAVFIAIAPGKIAARYESTFNMNDPTVRDRVAMLHIGGRMIRSHPLAGVGPNMVQRRYLDYRGDDAIEKVNPHLHDVPLQIAAERGLPALAAWLCFIVVVVVDLGRLFRAGAHRFLAAAGLAAVASMLTAGLFEYNFGDSEFLMLFLILITLPFAVERSAAMANAAGRRTA